MASKQLKFKGIQAREMAKCDFCGKYHPIEDCEVVVVKLIRGKDCSLESNPILTEKTVEPPQPIVESRPQPSPTTPKDFKEDAPGEGYHIPPKVMEQINESRKSIIPPELASMMIDASDPNFEVKGAKEIRKF